MSGVNIFTRLLESGIPSRDVQVALSETVSTEQQVATQDNHDNLNVNANLQFARTGSSAPADVSPSNPLPVTEQGFSRTVLTLGNTTGSNTIAAGGSTLTTAARYLERIIISANDVSPGDDHYVYVCDAAGTDFATDIGSAKLQLNICYSGTTVVECGFVMNFGITMYHTSDAFGDTGTASAFNNVTVAAVSDSEISRN